MVIPSYWDQRQGESVLTAEIRSITEGVAGVAAEGGAELAIGK